VTSDHQVRPPCTPPGIHARLRNVVKTFQAPARWRRAGTGAARSRLEEGRVLRVVGVRLRQVDLLALMAGLASASEEPSPFVGQSPSTAASSRHRRSYSRRTSIPWLTVSCNMRSACARPGSATRNACARRPMALSVMGLGDFPTAIRPNSPADAPARLHRAHARHAAAPHPADKSRSARSTSRPACLMGEELQAVARDRGHHLPHHPALDEAAMLADLIVVMSARPARCL